MIKLGLNLSSKQLFVLGVSSIIFFFLITYHFINQTANSSRHSPKQKCKAEIKMLFTAVRIYEDQYGCYPKYKSGILNFGEQLSKVPVNDPNWLGVRPMYIHYIKNNINASNDNFAEHNAKETIIYDPYGSPYQYNFIKSSFEKDATFEIVSAGEDGELGTNDDINSSKL